MSKRQFGTMKYIHTRGAIKAQVLRRVHGGTLNSLLTNKWVYPYTQSSVEYVALTDDGMAAFKEYAMAGLSLRKHEASLTENALRLLSYVRVKSNKPLLQMKKVG